MKADRLCRTLESVILQALEAQGVNACAGREWLVSQLPSAQQAQP